MSGSSVSGTVGHGPTDCVKAEVIICKWVTDNRSPGHHDAARYLASAGLGGGVKDNEPVKIICEFDKETLERTDAGCLADFIL